MSPESRKTANKPVFSGHFFKKWHFGSNREALGSGSGDNSGISSHLIRQLESAELSVQIETAQCMDLIQHALTQPGSIQKISELLESDPSGTILKYSVTIDIVLSEFKSGASVRVTEMNKRIADIHTPLSVEFLTKRINPLLIDMGILRKNQDNSYRWSSFEELANCLEVSNVALLYPGHRFTARPRHLCGTLSVAYSDLTSACRTWLLSKHPRAVKRQDGSIEITRKPFSKPYTPSEMKILEKQKADSDELKRLSKEAVDNEKKEKLKARIAMRSDHADVTAIYAEANKQVAEINAKKMVVYATATSYAPALIIVALIAAGYWMINRPAGNGEITEARFMQTEEQQAPAWAAELLGED